MPRYFLPYQQAIAQRVLDDPFFLGGNLVDLWLPTDNYLTNVSGACSTWRGMKQGISWVQASAGSRPTISNFQGTPCLNFNGTSHTMSLSSGLNMTNDVGGFTIATVHAWSAVPTTVRHIFVEFITTTANNRIFSDGGRTSGLEGSGFKRLTSDSFSLQPSQGSITANRPTIKIVSANYAANTNFTSTNGSIFTGVPSSSGAGNTQAANSVRIDLGSANGVGFFQGNIMMVVAVRAALSLPEANELGGIMAWMNNSQSSLIGSHPYANYPPMIGG